MERKDAATSGGDISREFWRLLVRMSAGKVLSRHRAGQLRAIEFLTRGYHWIPNKFRSITLFREDFHENGNCTWYRALTACEHHLLPFFKVHVAYIPNVILWGLSKIPWLVDVFARPATGAERLEILSCLDTIHFEVHGQRWSLKQDICVWWCGGSKQNSLTTSSAFYGCFQSFETRNEFLNF